VDRPSGEGPNGEESESTVRHERAVHQMSNDQFELPLDGRGEAPRAERSGEAMSAAQGDERSGLDTMRLMARMVEGGNLRRALKRVRQNKGSPGVDGLTVEELPGYLREHWPAIREQLLTGRYQPSVVKRVEIPKPGGGVRQLGIPTVLDRFIQQAVLQVPVSVKVVVA
jgi:RNA-directed DNA polymerase